MNVLRMAVMGGMVGALLAGGAWAQKQPLQPGQQPDQVKPTDPRQAGELCLSSKLVGMSVKAQQEQFGQVSDLLINNQGQVQYLAIDAQAQGRSPIPREKPARGDAEREGERPGTTATARGQLTLVPWEVVRIHEGATEAQQYVMINQTKEHLMQAPKFTQQQLAQKQQLQQLAAQVDKFFNIERRGVARPELNNQDPERPRKPINPRDEN